MSVRGFEFVDNLLHVGTDWGGINSVSAFDFLNDEDLVDDGVDLGLLGLRAFSFLRNNGRKFFDNFLADGLNLLHDGFGFSVDSSEDDD